MDEQVLPLLATHLALRVEGLDGVRRRDGHQPRAQLGLVPTDGQAVPPQLVAELRHPQLQHGRRSLRSPLSVPLEARERVVDATRRPPEGPGHLLGHFLRQGVDVGPDVVLRPQARQVDGFAALVHELLGERAPGRRLLGRAAHHRLGQRRQRPAYMDRV